MLTSKCLKIGQPFFKVLVKSIMIFFKNETWFVTTTRVGFWTWIWLMRYCELGPEVPCFFFSTGKTQHVSFDRSDNSGNIDMKMNGSILEKKNHILKYWDCFFSCELNWASYMVFIGKTASKKIGILIRTTKFFFVRLPFITINLPYALARNIVVIFRLVLLDSTWIC